MSKTIQLASLSKKAVKNLLTNPSVKANFSKSLNTSSSNTIIVNSGVNSMPAAAVAAAKQQKR